MVKAVLEGKWKTANSRADRVATSDPVPEGKDILVINAELLGQLQSSRACTHVLADDLRRLAEIIEEPLANGLSVEHCLGSSEGLGDDDKESLLSIEALKGPLHINGVDIGKELGSPALSGLLSSRVSTEGLEDELGT